jgi:hypothetical protein
MIPRFDISQKNRKTVSFAPPTRRNKQLNVEIFESPYTNNLSTNALTIRLLSKINKRISIHSLFIKPKRRGDKE